jgi:hypothetical protein
MISIIVWGLIIWAAATFAVMTGFLVYGSAKRVIEAKKRGECKPRALMYGVAVFWGVVGIVGDYVYNLLTGTFRFGAAGGLFGTYSSRVQNILDQEDSSNRDREEALRDARTLNVVDPAPHIRIKGTIP